MAELTKNTYRLSVRRRMPAPREVVYEAWIDPQGIREWMCPGDTVSTEALLDVRVGGSYLQPRLCGGGRGIRTRGTVLKWH